ncbi:hypothetical protein GW17_00025472 [Ensete ventricosum]|nr:hypothetical protein GW17_00025472 [Ensete ventricosum]
MPRCRDRLQFAAAWHCGRQRTSGDLRFGASASGDPTKGDVEQEGAREGPCRPPSLSSPDAGHMTQVRSTRDSYSKRNVHHAVRTTDDVEAYDSMVSDNDI